MQSNNKQLIAVFCFFLFIFSAIVIIATSGSNDDNGVMILKNDDSNKNINEVIPDVESSEPVKVVTSNNNSNSNSNNNSTSTGNDTATTSGNVPISYFITEAEKNKVYVGGTSKINVTIKPDNASLRAVTYSSSNTAIARVTSGGIIVGVNPGKCKIYVYVTGGGTSSFDFEVLNKNNSNSNSNSDDNTVKVTGVNLNSSNIEMNVGSKTTLVATITPNNATNKNITWTSSNTSVATVSNGVVMARSSGVAIISAVTKDGSKRATCRVVVNNPSPTVINVTGVSLNKATMNLYTGNTADLVATVSPSNATNKNITWTSSNTSVASVSNGVVTARRAGIAVISVTTSDGAKSASCVVYVTNQVSPTVKVTGVSLNKNSISLNTGSSYSLVATVSPSNATNKNITWTSSNTSVATVSNGVVTAKKAGTSTITVTTNDGNKKATCTVTVTNPVVHVTGVSLNRSSVSLKKGNTTSLTATVSPSNATNKNVTWTSSNTSVATVSNGVITAKKAGTSTITVITNDGNKKATCTVTVTNPKNGWYTENGKKYYYKDDKKLTSQFVDYIYLDSTGAAMDKMGSFNITVYRSTAWANQKLNVRKSSNGSSAILGTIPEGGKVTILSSDSNGYIKVMYGDLKGYVYANYLFINLPDVMPGIYYDITSAYSATSVSAGYSIPNVTGKKLYKFSKKWNSKINRSEWYVPLLYPTAKKLQNAYNTANKEGYSFIIYDTYRPRPVEEYVTKYYTQLYNSNSKVKKAVDYDKEGNYWGWPWFMTKTGTSRHCQGIAIDMALANKSGKELKAQTNVDVLDTSALRKYNNGNANTLSRFMTGAGFNTLASEWWHFQDDTYMNNDYETFYIWD